MMPGPCLAPGGWARLLAKLVVLARPASPGPPLRCVSLDNVRRRHSSPPYISLASRGLLGLPQALLSFCRHILSVGRKCCTPMRLSPNPSEWKRFLQVEQRKVSCCSAIFCQLLPTYICLRYASNLCNFLGQKQNS